MTHTTTHATLRRTSSALGAAAVLGLALSGPALARPEPGPGARTAPACCVIDTTAYGTHYGTTTVGNASHGGSANASEHGSQQPQPRGLPSYNTWPDGGKGDAPGSATAVSNPVGSSIEALQVGLGALGGAALTAAAVTAMASRRRHHLAHA